MKWDSIRKSTVKMLSKTVAGDIHFFKQIFRQNKTWHFM